MIPQAWSGTTFVVLFITAFGAAAAQRAADLVASNAFVVDTSYNGRRAVRIDANADAANATSYAIVKNTSLQDGTIEVDVAGRPAAGASADARGFIGVGFRLRDGHYEYVYLRPTNGRADDQVRRNHATQYSSYPDFDYARSRAEAPGKYESYVDLEPGVASVFDRERPAPRSSTGLSRTVGGARH